MFAGTSAGLTKLTRPYGCSPYKTSANFLQHWRQTTTNKPLLPSLSCVAHLRIVSWKLCKLSEFLLSVINSILSASPPNTCLVNWQTSQNVACASVCLLQAAGGVGTVEFPAERQHYTHDRSLWQGHQPVQLCSDGIALFHGPCRPGLSTQIGIGDEALSSLAPLWITSHIEELGMEALAGERHTSLSLLEFASLSSDHMRTLFMTAANVTVFPAPMADQALLCLIHVAFKCCTFRCATLVCSCCL